MTKVNNNIKGQEFYSSMKKSKLDECTAAE